jgi:hypothetical protein
MVDPCFSRLLDEAGRRRSGIGKIGTENGDGSHCESRGDECPRGRAGD